MPLFVESSYLNGSIKIPPSKSHTMRAIVFASLAKGESLITDYLHSPDTDAMIQAVSCFGAKVEKEHSFLKIVGVGGNLRAPDDVIHSGNSGLVFRFMGALAGLVSSYTIITGDHSIRNNRVVTPLIEGLNQLGAFATPSREKRGAPLIVKGPFTQNKAVIDGKDSQPVSGLLIAASFAPHPITIEVKDPGEKPWIDMTLDWLKKMGISYVNNDYTHYELQGNSKIDGFSYKVPGDFSSLAFPLVASIITNSEVKIENVPKGDVQGDQKIIPLLQKMGANIDWREDCIYVGKSKNLVGQKIDINEMIDALPILAVLGCFVEGKTEIFNGQIARKKESDRISCIVKELKKMGANIYEKEDGVIVYPSSLHGIAMETHQDHRLALSLIVAGLGSKGRSAISGWECIDKSYPNFYDDFRTIGAKIDYSIWV